MATTQRTTRACTRPKSTAGSTRSTAAAMTLRSSFSSRCRAPATTRWFQRPRCPCRSRGALPGRSCGCAHGRTAEREDLICGLLGGSRLRSSPRKRRRRARPRWLQRTSRAGCWRMAVGDARLQRRVRPLHRLAPYLRSRSPPDPRDRRASACTALSRRVCPARRTPLQPTQSRHAGHPPYLAASACLLFTGFGELAGRRPALVST